MSESITHHHPSCPARLDPRASCRVLPALREHLAVAWLIDVRAHGIDAANRRSQRRCVLVGQLFGIPAEQLA